MPIGTYVGTDDIEFVQPREQFLGHLITAPRGGRFALTRRVIG